MPIVVSDTSPIRALEHLGQLDLLASLFGQVLVPPAVVDELRKPGRLFSSLDLTDRRFIIVQAPQQRKLVLELGADLEEGESEALALAVEVKADAVLIDEEWCCTTAGGSIAPR